MLQVLTTHDCESEAVGADATVTIFWGSIGIMEKNTETTTVYWGGIVIKGLAELLDREIQPSFATRFSENKF